MNAKDDKEAREILKKDVKGKYELPALDRFKVRAKTHAKLDQEAEKPLADIAPEDS